MRISGGEWRGRRLAVPEDGTVRPTQDRVREALFSMLAQVVPGARFLDLFAGSGGVGLEALSRGAAECTFVDSAPKHLSVLRANAASLGAESRCRLVCADAFKWLETPPQEKFDVVFADPPYREGGGDTVERMLSLLAQGMMSGKGVFAAEAPVGARPPEMPGWRLCRDREYGQTRLAVYQLLGDEGGSAP